MLTSKVASVIILPLTAALVPGLADLFLMPLSAAGSSSTSFSALELRLLGPLGFSTAALREPQRRTTKEERKTGRGSVSNEQPLLLCSTL